MSSFAYVETTEESGEIAVARYLGEVAEKGSNGEALAAKVQGFLEPVTGGVQVTSAVQAMLPGLAAAFAALSEAKDAAAVTAAADLDAACVVLTQLVAKVRDFIMLMTKFFGSRSLPPCGSYRSGANLKI
jgi:hypothetical protein